MAATVHATLTGTTADDDVTVDGNPDFVDVLNRSSTEALWVRADGTTAVAAAAGTRYVAPGGWLRVGYNEGGLSLVGDGNDYSVEPSA